MNAHETRTRSSWLACLLVGTACLTLGGCADFWDDLTSREHHFGQMFKAPPDPLIVLRDDTDGDHRARALRALKEPQQYGGTQAQQDQIVAILCTAVVNERQPLCRLAAIESLSHFKDERAVEALKEAYYRASSFDPEKATVLRCSALRALGETHNSKAVSLLVHVVNEPPAEGPNIDRQQVLDERIAAARALGNFHREQATKTLVGVLRTEQDVALRDRAAESLEHVTGQHLPTDAVAWDNYLQKNPIVDQPDDKPSGVIPVSGTK